MCCAIASSLSTASRRRGLLGTRADSLLNDWEPDAQARGLRSDWEPDAQARELRKALTANPAAEPKRRIDRLLKEIEAHNLTSDERREVLAVQVLTWTNTDSARRLLAKWAKGDPNAILTKAAGEAIGR